MSEQTVCLVDGVGRPKLLDLPVDPDLPATIGYKHEGIASGPESRVVFVRSEELDPEGRIVYRQRGVYRAPIRERWFEKFRELRGAA